MEGVLYRRNRNQLVPAPLIEIKSIENSIANNGMSPTPTNRVVNDCQASVSSSLVHNDNGIDLEQDTSETVPEVVLNDAEPGRHSKRNIKKPGWLEDYVT